MLQRSSLADPLILEEAKVQAKMSPPYSTVFSTVPVNFEALLKMQHIKLIADHDTFPFVTARSIRIFVRIPPPHY